MMNNKENQMKATKKQYESLIKKLEQAEISIAQMNEKTQEMEKEFAASVQSPVKGNTTTLTVGDRVVKCVSKTFGRGARGYQITENGKVIGKEYRGSIYGLKIQLALGAKTIGFFG